MVGYDVYVDHEWSWFLNVVGFSQRDRPLRYNSGGRLWFELAPLDRLAKWDLVELLTPAPSDVEIDTQIKAFDSAKPTNPKDAIGVRKVNLSCLPAGVLLDLALALMEGAAKYGRHNYRGAGVRSSVYYDAAMGHLMDWWEGDDVDAESGLSHITKAMASLTVLRDAMLQDMLTDDRPPRSKVFKRDFNPMAGQILDRHSDKTPHHWTIKDVIEKGQS